MAVSLPPAGYVRPEDTLSQEGAMVGGRLLGGVGVTGFNIWSILIATLGAIILLAIYRLITAGRQKL